MIIVVGMGTKAGDVSQRGAEAIKNAQKVVVKTGLTATYAFFGDIEHVTLDHLYESAGTFTELDELIAREVTSFGDCVYCVDGSGADDGSVRKLAESAEITIIPGVSLGAEGLCRVPSLSYSSYSASDYDSTLPLVRRFPTVFTEIDSRIAAGELKLTLMDKMGEEEDVLFYDGEAWKAIPLYELDRQEDYCYYTKCVIPERGLEKDRYDFSDLLQIMNRLRAPDGCPWDRAQTHESIKKCLIEESGELCDAIDNNDVDNMCEESGDVLLQAVFHAKIGEDTGEYTVNEMISGLCQKLISRHTHIFGDVVANSPEEALVAWQNAKKLEKERKAKR
ncbi:MAG: MazG nucleotide pyrophosphohydrolase domain-containing protein [Christensenellales bacterium]